MEKWIIFLLNLEKNLVRFLHKVGWRRYRSCKGL